jgi:glycosyltransferase involved in cell wall biosynthesis
MKRKIVHIIDRLSSGGASRAAITHARECARKSGDRHEIISLNDAERPARELAESFGIRVISQPARETLVPAVEAADIVHIHFYNTPAIYNFFNLQLPPSRRLLWAHISGFTPPQLLPIDIAKRVDYVVLTSEESRKLPAAIELSRRGRSPAVIVAGADFTRLEGIKTRPHGRFTAGYIGTIDPVKMYPRFVELSAAIEVEDIKFLVCGGNADYLRDKIGELSAEHKFELKGYVADIAPLLEVMDVFGYPLAKETYSTTDQSLQEAMYAGVPPVVFDHGATSKMVRHNHCGIVATSEEEYRRAVEFLAKNPKKRAELARNAQQFAQTEFGVMKTSPQLDDVYRMLMNSEKSAAKPILSEDSGGLRGSSLFIASLGEYGGDFAISRDGSEPDQRAADDRIARQSRLMTSPQSGGILHWAQYFQADPFLRMWAGLVLTAAGRNARALIEFGAAVKAGGDAGRLSKYMRPVAEALHVSPDAIAAMLKRN